MGIVIGSFASACDSDNVVFILSYFKAGCEGIISAIGRRKGKHIRFRRGKKKMFSIYAY